MTVIRPYRSRDAEALSRLYVASVEGLGPGHYAPEQVRVWAGLAPSAHALDELMTDGRTRLLAVDEADAPVAFADLKPDGLIHFLYCAPEAAGRGVATQLYGVVEARAREAGLSRLTAEASEAAKRFLIRRGFVLVQRRDFEVAGVAIHNFLVEKDLQA